MIASRAYIIVRRVRSESARSAAAKIGEHMGVISQLADQLRHAASMNPEKWSLEAIRQLLYTAADTLDRFQREEDDRGGKRF
jgi:hypothetical protein